MVKISPSVLACDLSKLAEGVKEIELAGADMAHLDVMDGVFVTNISFGMPVIECLRKHTDMFLDIHLMIINPENYIERFIDAGADLVTFHLEATKNVDKCIEMIRARGKKVGISIKPDTRIESVYQYLEKCDMVLVMTVEPGYGGQSLIPFCLDKVKVLRDEIEKRGLNVDIQVDGGINQANASEAIKAGANVLVAGSSVYKSSNKKAAIDALR